LFVELTLVLAAELLLQRLHVAAVVVLLHERALRIRPFEHDELAAIVGEPDRLAARIVDRKDRCGLSRGVRQGCRCQRDRTEERGERQRRVAHEGSLIAVKHELQCYNVASAS
jgi:hypothetical protein